MLSALLATVPVLPNRPLPGSDGSVPSTGSGELDTFNLLFIVGFAVLIAVLARRLSTRGRKK